MRYTAWDPGLGRWVVQCLHKPNGEQITFCVFEKPAEAIENNTGKKTLCPSAPKVYGEAIDRLAELENQKETDRKTIAEYEDRLRHLLRSKTIQLFDEYDPKTGTYKRDIRRLDTYGVNYKILEYEKQNRRATPPPPPKPTFDGNLVIMEAPQIEKAPFRPCEADGKPAIFHRWVNESWVVQPSPMIGGHPGGTVRCTFALVEYEDGTVRKVEPENIKFTDREGEQ